MRAGAFARASRFELSLQLALGGPLFAIKGFASSEAEAACLRAQELSRELESETDLFAALRLLGYVYHVTCDECRLRPSGIASSQFGLGKRWIPAPALGPAQDASELTLELTLVLSLEPCCRRGIRNGRLSVAARFIAQFRYPCGRSSHGHRQLRSTADAKFSVNVMQVHLHGTF